MPRIHLTCDKRLKESEVTPGQLYCATCIEVVEKKDTYKVGQRYFQSERTQLEEQKKKKASR